jgi:hypothetical protein
MGAVEELVKKSGGCAVIDGGFATQLEALGADINDPLWSAACLISKPHLVKEVTTARRPPNQRACKCLVVFSPWELASVGPAATRLDLLAIAMHEDQFIFFRAI